MIASNSARIRSGSAQTRSAKATRSSRTDAASMGMAMLIAVSCLGADRLPALVG